MKHINLITTLALVALSFSSCITIDDLRPEIDSDESEFEIDIENNTENDTKVLLAGTSQEGKTWIIDNETIGYLGCGGSVKYPIEWWAASPDDLYVERGLYDDEITFCPDGKYIYNPGKDGQLFVNSSVTKIGYNPKDSDMNVEFVRVESKYTLEEDTIILPEHTPMVYVPSDLIWDTPIFHITELSETTLRVVAENPGCYWQMIYRVKDKSVYPDDNSKNEPFDPMSPDNLWKEANIDVSFWFSDDSWSQIDDPVLTIDENKFTVILPDGMGSEQWQGQMKFKNTGITISTSIKYDFHLVLNSTSAHPGVLVQLSQDVDSLDKKIMTSASYPLKQHEDFSLDLYAVSGVDAENVELLLDFGGGVGGSTVVIKDIVIREHK